MEGDRLCCSWCSGILMCPVAYMALQGVLCTCSVPPGPLAPRTPTACRYRTPRGPPLAQAGKDEREDKDKWKVGGPLVPDLGESL